MLEVALSVRCSLINILFGVLGAQNQSIPQNWDASVEASIKWFFFNIVLALLPLLLNLMLIKVGSVKTNWSELLKDGELFFFSTTIAASSIGTLLFQEPSSPIIASLVSYFLMVILMISTGMFALSSFLKLKQMDVIDKKIFSASSAWCAVLTIVLSYFAFVQGGMK